MWLIAITFSFAHSINNQQVGTANNMHRQYYFDITV
jgi:hypothetical protein